VGKKFTLNDAVQPISLPSNSSCATISSSKKLEKMILQENHAIFKTMSLVLLLV